MTKKSVKKTWQQNKEASNFHVYEFFVKITLFDILGFLQDVGIFGIVYCYLGLVHVSLIWNSLAFSSKSTILQECGTGTQVACKCKHELQLWAFGHCLSLGICFVDAENTYDMTYMMGGYASKQSSLRAFLQWQEPFINLNWLHWTSVSAGLKLLSEKTLGDIDVVQNLQVFFDIPWMKEVTSPYYLITAW